MRKQQEAAHRWGELTLDAVAWTVPNLGGAVEAYRRYYAPEAVRRDGHSAVVTLERGAIILSEGEPTYLVLSGQGCCPMREALDSGPFLTAHGGRWHLV